MAAKEVKARIKLNKLLEESGWRFFDDAMGKANIVLEPKVKLTKAAIDALGDNFEDASNGFIDFLLLDEAGFPQVVLEAKSKDKNPLVGNEQARKYAKSQNCRFVILSNGNLHYFWDLEQGNPHIVTRFPAPDSIKSYHRFQPNPQRLITEPVSKDSPVTDSGVGDCRIGERRCTGEALLYPPCRTDPDRRPGKTHLLRDRMYTQRLVHVLASKYEELRRISDARGGNQSNLNAQLIRDTKIPLPDFETQRAIVAEIEAEQALVKANKQLIERFEAKVKATINRVWGETQ